MITVRAPYSALYSFARRELVDGRSSIDVIADLELRGCSPLEAEDIVEKCIEEFAELKDVSQ